MAFTALPGSKCLAARKEEEKFKENGRRMREATGSRNQTLSPLQKEGIKYGRLAFSSCSIPTSSPTC